MRAIKINVSNFLLDCLISDDEAPTADSLKELVYATAVPTAFNEIPEGLLDGLVRAYVAQATYDAAQESDDGEPGFELVSGNDADTIYMKFVVKGYRAVSKQTRKDVSDESIYEGCDWFESIVDGWPDQLLAEVAYAKGRRAAREAIAFGEYYASRKAAEAAGEKTS
jgi:hypothetical protein